MSEHPRQSEHKCRDPEAALFLVFNDSKGASVTAAKRANGE